MDCEGFDRDPDGLDRLRLTELQETPRTNQNVQDGRLVLVKSHQTTWTIERINKYKTTFVILIFIVRALRVLGGPKD